MGISNIKKVSIIGRLKVTTGNGHGATNTAIRRFTTIEVQTNTQDVTYADSAANGATFTIVRTGTYFIQYADQLSSANAALGISVDSSQLTTSIVSITSTDRVTVTVATSNAARQVAVARKFNTGQVLRCHTDGTLNNATSAQSYVEIIRIGD
jgi:hypothetical protein